MEKLIEKIRLKDSQRICIINPDKNILSEIESLCPETIIDQKINPRFLYNFFVIFVSSIEEIDDLSNRAIHNLYEDGYLWFIYPKGSNGQLITRDKGWDMLKTLGFKPVKHIVVDERSSGIRFRNSRFVKSRNRSKDN